MKFVYFFESPFEWFLRETDDKKQPVEPQMVEQLGSPKLAKMDGTWERISWEPKVPPPKLRIPQ